MESKNTFKDYIPVTSRSFPKSQCMFPPVQWYSWQMWCDWKKWVPTWRTLDIAVEHLHVSCFGASDISMANIPPAADLTAKHSRWMNSPTGKLKHVYFGILGWTVPFILPIKPWWIICVFNSHQQTQDNTDLSCVTAHGMCGQSFSS